MRSLRSWVEGDPLKQKQRSEWVGRLRGQWMDLWDPDELLDRDRHLRQCSWMNNTTTQSYLSHERAIA